MAIDLQDAVDLQPSAPAARKRVSAWRILLPLALATALLTVGAFVAWQAWLVQHSRSSVAQAQVARDAAAASIADLIRDRTAKLEAALGDPALLAALASDNETGRINAAMRLRVLLPDIERVRFFTSSLDEVIAGNLAKLGYSQAAALMLTQALEKPAPARADIEQGLAVGLVLAMPVHDQGVIVGYVLARWPWQPVLDALQARDVAPARMDLRQGDGHNGIRIASAGAEARGSDSDAGVPIVGARMRIGVAAPGYFVVMPRQPLNLMLIALGFVVAGLLALWLRHIGNERALGMLRRRRTPDGESQLTLDEVLRNEEASGENQAEKLDAPKAEAKSAEPPPIAIDPGIFRAYDIRGVVGKTLDAGVARLIGQAIGSEAQQRNLADIVVGRDGRTSSPEMAEALIAGLRASGIDVIDIGAVPTPVTYFASRQFGSGSGVSVTGSHNPSDHNGFKIVLGDETLAEDAIHSLYTRISENDLRKGNGGLQVTDATSEYIGRISEDILVSRKLKVVVDCGNGIAGNFAPGVLSAVGCEVEPLYCEVDGTFPNHHPDPSDPDNLKDLILAVGKMGADLGLAFDGDGDRLGVVTPKGEIIFPDRLLMLFAADLLERNPGATIIYDVKCSNRLQPLILANGGSPLMWKTGHSLIKAKMRETEALLAGEMSGHFFFKERWYGFDDGIYAAARLVEILAGDVGNRSPQEIFDSLPKDVSTPELKLPVPEGSGHAFVESFVAKAKFDRAHLTTIDGLRADWPDGFGLVRASNTTSVLVLRFAADNRAALERIQEAFRSQLLALDAELELPF